MEMRTIIDRCAWSARLNSSRHGSVRGVEDKVLGVDSRVSGVDDRVASVGERLVAVDKIAHWQD